MNNNAFVLVPIAQYLGVLHLRATIYNLLILVVGLIGRDYNELCKTEGEHPPTVSNLPFPWHMMG